MVISQGWEFAFWFFEQIIRFCEQKSEIAIPSFPRANHSCCSLKKSNKAKSYRIDLLLGLKRGKQWKTVKNMVKTTNFFQQITRFVRAKEQKCDTFSKNEQITRVGHSILFRSVHHFLFRSKKRTFRSFSFFSWVFGNPWDPKERSVLFCAFLINRKERKEPFVLLQRTEKNAKNGKECKNVLFFFPYIYRNIYRYI